MKAVVALASSFDLWNAPDWLVPRLRDAFPQVDFVHLADYALLQHELADADIYFGYSLRPGQLAAAKKLRWIHSTAAAVHQLLIPELLARDIVLSNARDVHGPVVAEHAIALMLALAKRLPSAFRFQQEKRWAQDELWRERPRELQGSTLGLIGCGAIGREVARCAIAFGMRVLAVREHPDRQERLHPIDDLESRDPVFLSDALQTFTPAHLDSVLAQSDFVVLAVPVTPRTERMIDARRLARFQPHAFLINVGRGALIDDAALIAALGQGRLAGAALDVFAEEPLPPESPYWPLPNVLVTPHTAAVTDKLWERHFAQISDNLRRFLASQPLRSVVDKSRGY